MFREFNLPKGVHHKNKTSPVLTRLDTIPQGKLKIQSQLWCLS